MQEHRKTVILSLYLATACVVHVLENMIPIPAPLPGLKLGLANMVSVIVLYQFGWLCSLRIACLRVVIGALFGGMMFGPAFFLSFGGAIGSVVLMAFIHGRWPMQFSMVGISIWGAVAHQLMQIVLAAIIVSSLSVLWYLPYLLFTAVPVGMATGAAAYYFSARMGIAVLENQALRQ